MKRELDYFEIEGAYGGSQDWFTNVVMHIGGCAAAAACDSCIYFALRGGMPELYPYEICRLTREDYKKFSAKMKPFLRPRRGGVDRLELFMEGFAKYLEEHTSRMGRTLCMEPFHGERPAKEAAEAVRAQIDQGYPVPFLLLKHRDKERFRDFIWHWFLLTGYEQASDGFWVTAATYGAATRLPFTELWETGHEQKGGMILYQLKNTHQLHEMCT